MTVFSSTYFFIPLKRTKSVQLTCSMLPPIVLNIVLSITTKHNFIPIFVWTPDWKMLQNFECRTGHSLTESPPGPLEQGVLHSWEFFRGKLMNPPKHLQRVLKRHWFWLRGTFLFVLVKRRATPLHSTAWDYGLFFFLAHLLVNTPSQEIVPRCLQERCTLHACSIPLDFGVINMAPEQIC